MAGARPFSASDYQTAYAPSAVPVTVALSGTTNRNSANLAAGLYFLTSDIDCFVLAGGTGVNATTGSIPLWSKQAMLVYMDGDANVRIAGITSGATGTLYIVPRATN